MMSTILLSIFVVFVALYYYLKTNYEYWTRRGVPGPKPTLFVGNMGASLTLKKSAFDIYAEIYRKYKKYPFAGIFKTTSPTLVICSPEVIKDMTVKSFNNFHDNDIDVDKKKDPIFGRNPFCLKGEEWKTVRSCLTPGFTSGKMKFIYPLLENTSHQMVKFIGEEPNCTNGQGYEAKALCSKFTLNNVATCAFGIEGKAFEEESSELKEVARDLFKVGIVDTILFAITFLIPVSTKLFSLKFIKKEIEDKLFNVIAETLKYREKNNVVRNDYLHILTQLKESTDHEFTDLDVAAHAATFFFDGYETSAGIFSFVLYQLASHSDIQEKLRQELLGGFDEDGNISYEALQGLPYLDAVINETLRLHPPLFALGKKCTKTYTYLPKKGDGIEKPVVIEEGTSIVIPLSGFHTDPQYFEEPDTFNPDRFMGANKEKIAKYTFMPFGEGPRNCLGKRFGVLQIKIGLAHVIKNFELSLNGKTQLPIEYDPLGFLTIPKGGLWVDFKQI